jgi:hypothetical protein
VEKRLLEGKVDKLDGEVAERDRLDAQIEAGAYPRPLSSST